MPNRYAKVSHSTLTYHIFLVAPLLLLYLLFYVHQHNPFPDITISRYYEFVGSIRVKTAEYLVERGYFSFTSHQPLLPLG